MIRDDLPNRAWGTGRVGALSAPLPFGAYAFLAITLLGWAWAHLAVSVEPVDRMFATPPDSPASVGRDYRTTDREIHVCVTVPSSHPGRREALPADRTSRALHRLLRCRQPRALPSKDSSRAGSPASCHPSPRRSPW